MRKEERAEVLLETVGDIREQYILEAEAADRADKAAEKAAKERENGQEQSGRVKSGNIKNSWFGRFPAVPLFCAAALIALIAVNVPKMSEHGGKDKNEYMTEHNTKEIGTTVAVVAGENETQNETIIIPRWDEMDLTGQYGSFEYDGREYNANGAKLGDYTLGEPLGSIMLKGYDIYEDKEYEAKGEIYSIEGISAECALALWFTEPAGTEYYIYINSWYTPQTLGQFMEDLNFYEGLRATRIGQLRLLDGSGTGGGLSADMEYTTAVPSRELLLEQLSEYRDLENVYERDNEKFNWATTFMSFGVTVPLSGGEVSIWITENGYLVTNIFETGKAFYLGRDAAFAMMNALSGEETDWAHISEVLDKARQDRQNQIEPLTTSASSEPEVRVSEPNMGGTGGTNSADNEETAQQPMVKTVEIVTAEEITTVSD